MKENKIINRASLEVELCDHTHIIESNPVEAEAINIKVEKTQSCDKVLVGGVIKYTIKIISECGEAEDLLFKDIIDDCTRFVDDSFTVNGKREKPNVKDNILTFKIDKLESCETITITFEVEVTKQCCSCHPHPEKSKTPTTRLTVSRYERSLTGSGERGAIIHVKYPDGSTSSTSVNLLRSWTISLPLGMSSGDLIYIIQEEQGKAPSDTITVRVI